MILNIYQNQEGSVASLMHSSSGVDVDFDATFLIQAAFFILLFLILRPLLFKPMIRLLEERERRIDGAKDEARQLYTEADMKMVEYENHVVEVKRQAGQERDRLRTEGQRLEQQILSQARDESNLLLEEGKIKLTREAETLRAELGVQAQHIAREIANRALGREVAS